MSHYKPYPAYKDSGVEWLGEVPEHWEISQLKYLATHIGSGKTPSGGAEVYQDSGVLFLRSQNVYEDGLRLDDAVFISESVDQEMAGSRVQEYDVLLNITGASIGRSCLVSEGFQQANVNQHVCIVRAADTSLAKWLSQCLPSLSVQAQIDFFQNGAGREGLNFEQIGNMYVALPLVNEVGEISDALDSETARIDALINRKTRFIELLREKRQALITHAVTKGLDPSVKMKDSGVEWLGEVPEHWDVLRLRFLTEINPPIRSDLASAPNMEVSFLPMEHIGEDGSLRLEMLRPVESVRSGYSYFEDGDVAFAKVTPCFENGKGALMQGLVGGVGFGTTELTVLRPNERVTAGFINLVVNSISFRRHGAGSMTGAGGLKRVPDEFTRNFVAAVPPVGEQQVLTAYLDREAARIESLQEKTERSIELLKERRSALITAAVTGQIDLRETTA